MNALEKDDRNKEYTDHFSPDISDEIKKYAIEEAFKFSRYIFTRKDKKQQYGYCTHCEAEFKTDSLKHNEETTCPKCRSKVMIKSGGMGRKYMIDTVYFVYYEKSKKDSNVLIARGIQAQRDYRYNYKNLRTEYFLKAMYVFEPNKGGSMLEQSYYDDDYSKRAGIFSLAGPLESRGCKTCYSRKSIEVAVKGTPFQYSTWKSYFLGDMVKFFALYAKYPCLEYLSKLGLENIVENKLHNWTTYSSVNWNGKTILKVLKLSKKDLNELRKLNFTITPLFLRLFQISKKDNLSLSPEDILTISKSYGHDLQALQKVLKYTSLRKANKYICKQNDNDTINYHAKTQVLTAWKDYLNDCITLEMNLDDDRILFPKELHKAHQETLVRIKTEADVLMDRKISEKISSLEKYCFEYNGLMIRPAVSTKELIREGKALKHCVGNYNQKYMIRYSKGQIILLLIRKITEPDTPFFTVEIEKNAIKQVHGYGNYSPDKKEKEFLEVFKAEKLTKKKVTIKNKIAIPA